MSCDINTINAMRESLLAQGYSLDQVNTFIELFKLQNSDNGSMVEEIVKSSAKEKPILSEDERVDLRGIFNKLNDRIEKTVGSIDKFTESFDIVVEKLLSVEEKERLYGYLKKLSVGGGSIISQTNDYISAIEGEIKTQRALGNEAFAQELEQDLIKEKERIAKYNSTRKTEQTAKNALITKIANIRKMAQMASAIAEGSLSKVENEAAQAITEARNKVQNKKNIVAELKTRLANLKDELKKYPKSLVKIAATEAKRTEIKNKIDKAKTELKAAQGEIKTAESDLAKLIQEYVEKDVLGKDGKLKNLSPTLKKFLNRLSKEEQAAQEKLNKSGLKEFIASSRKISENLKVKVAKESKALREIRTGYKQRMGFVNTYIEEKQKLNTSGVPVPVFIDLNFAVMLVGPSAVQHYLHNVRPRLEKEKDGTDIDMSPLNSGEMIKILKSWRGRMINSINNGYYSSDLSVLNDENLNYMRAIANNVMVVDLGNPNLFDMVVTPDMLPEQALAIQTLGTIPVSNRAETGAQLAAWIESTRNTLLSLKSAEGFTGTIPEALLRMALHQKLFDIAPTAFTSALKQKAKKRNLQSGNFDEIIGIKNLLSTIGVVNVNELPEFKDPDWQNNFEQLVAFDIETDDTDVQEIRSIQIETYENGKRVKYVYVNSDNNLVNAITDSAVNRQPLNKSQIESLLYKLEELQNKGYKVVTHNGNSFDFKNLHKFGVDTNLLMRVSLRSIDLQRNLGFDNRQKNTGEYSRKAPAGAQLKLLAELNLPTKAVVAYDGKVIFRNGTVQYISRPAYTDETGIIHSEVEEELKGGEDIKTYWSEGQSSGDWTKFDAYAQNDTMLTIDLARLFGSQDAIDVKLEWRKKDSKEPKLTYNITTFKPRSNLFLASSDNSDGQLTFSHIVDDLLKLDPKLETLGTSINFTYELEYDLNKILDILDNWLIQAWALDPENKPKLNLLLDGLNKQKIDNNITNDLVIKIAKENRAVLKGLLKTKFARFGYVDRFNGSDGKLDSDAFTIDTETNRATLDQDKMYSTSTSELDYENSVYSYLAEFVNNSDFMSRKEFVSRLVNRFKARTKMPNEEDIEYFKDIIPSILKKYLPEFNRISDFGNGNLDWKPAYEMGIAIAQMLMDQKPGIIQIDNVLISGENVVSTMLLQGTSAVYNGRSKNFILPDKSKVHFGSPFGIVEEEKAYDNWRLLNRVKFILTNEIPMDKFNEFIGTYDPDADPSVPISYFVNAQINTIFPRIRDRTPYSNLMTLNERKITAMEFMYDIPRLLSCFNHDCVYWGLNDGGRFLKDELPVYYKDNYLSAGAPTASAVLAGAIDQVAWMSVFDFGDAAGEAELLRSIKSGVEMLRSAKDPKELINMTNKSDYKYSGLHITLAAMTFYEDSSFSAVNPILKALGFSEILQQEMVVPASGLKDPRYAAVDAMAEDFNLLSRDKNAYKEKHRLSDLEIEILGKVVENLQKNREDAKEFLKGAITPRFYSAGFKGIFEGLQNKNKDKNLGYSTQEIRVVTKVLLRQLMNSHLTLIDQAIGLSQADVDSVKKIFLTNLKPKINRESMANALDSSFFGELEFKDRLTQMENYFTKYINILAEQITPRMPDREKKIEEVKKALRDEYSEKLKTAAALFNKKDISTMSLEERAELQNNVNQVLAGSITLDIDPKTNTFKIKKGRSNGYDKHLILWALNRRAATPFKLLEDNLELQRLVTGVHIDPKDYEGYINKTIFHTYGLEIASGRNHMFGNWGNGPESSKLAQVRVETGKEANKLGIWDIAEMDTTPEYWEKTFAQQVLMDLAPYYLPPTYDRSTESREEYWKQNEERSIKELEAQGFANFVVNEAASNPNRQIGDYTAAELKTKIEQYAGTPSQRFRLRTLASDIGNKDNLIAMDAAVEGLGSYRPIMSDIDFSQRSIFALMEMQHAIKSEDLRESQVIEQIQGLQAKTPTNPNEIIPLEHRGHVPIYNKETLPFIPQQTSDTLSSLITGPLDPAAQRAIRIKNQVTGFAKAFGWDELLDKKDWTRLHLLQQLRSKAYLPALQVFENGSENNLNLAVQAKAEFFDGFFKTLGTRTKVFLKGKNYSAIDLMTNPEDLGISARDIVALTLKHKEALSWFNVLTYLGKRIDRLAPIKFGLVMDPGIVVRGKPGLIKNPTRTQPINIFGLEVRQIYKWILASETFRDTATEYLLTHHPEMYKSMVDKKQVDSNGFVLLESLPLDEGLQEKIAKEAFRKTRQLAIELNSKFSFVVTDRQLHMLEDQNKAALRETATSLTGPIAVQARAEGYTITNTALDNPNTLWAFTEDMVVQMLNSLANDSLFTNVELAFQTNKDIGTVETDLDKLVREEERQLFDRMSALEEETFEALTLLHKLETDSESTPALVIQDYRNPDKMGKPKLTVDIPAYFTSPFKLHIDGRKVFTTLEDSVYITDILQVAKLADTLGMDAEAKEIKNFLYLQLMSNNPDIQTEDDSIYSVTSQPVLKLAALLLKAEGSLDASSGTKRRLLVQFVQPGLSPEGTEKLLGKAKQIVRVMQRVTNTSKEENNQYYYMASAHFDRTTNLKDDITSNTKFVDSLVISSGNKLTEVEKQKAIKGIKKAYLDFTTLPQKIDLSVPGVDYKSNVTQFADKDKFIEAFGNTGENIVNQLQGLVTQGLLSQRTMDMKLIMIGTLAMNNRGILEDLNLESREDMGPHEFAVASKRNNKYSIGLNINAMKVTPENEILLKFAEELVHIARIKYMDINSYDFKRMMGAFSTKRAKPMIKEMLLAMNLNKPYDLLEKDVDYATKNVEEFLAHYGAMILLQETVYRSDVLTYLETKYEAVNNARNWWNRAFHNIKYIAKRVQIKFTQLQNDPYYGEVYGTANSVIQNLLFNSVAAGRIDVGNPNMEFNAFANHTTTETTLTPEQKANVLALSQRQVAIERRLEAETLDAATQASLSTELGEIRTRLRDPKINPNSSLRMRESEIQTSLQTVKRVDGRIIQRTRPDLATRALFAEGMNNWIIARGKRVDNADTLAGMLRLFPDESDKMTRLLQNVLLQGFNQTNLSYNSPEALIVMISDLIDNWTVTTQSTYLPSATSGGFMANKLALDGYVGNLRHNTSIVARNFTNMDARQRINLNVMRNLQGLPLTISDPLEITAVQNITKAYQLWHTRLGEELVNSRIKKPGSINYMDKVGLKLKDSRLLSKEERNKGFVAIRNLIQKKTLRRLDADLENAVVSPYIAFLGGMLLNPDTAITQQPEFAPIYQKFIADPNAIANTAQEVIMKLMVNRAIEKYARDNGIASKSTAATQFMETSGNTDTKVQEQYLEFIYMTREHETTFAEAFNGISREDMDLILKQYRQIVANNASNSLIGERFKYLIGSDFGFYMGESQYGSDYTPENSPLDALTYEFFGKLGATAYLFDTRSPFLTSNDIFLENNPDVKADLDTARAVFDGDIDGIGLSLLRGVGYDAIQRILAEQMFGIPGFNFSIQQIISMARGIVNSADPSSKIYGIVNLDGRTRDEEIKNLLMASLERLENANKDARGTLGNRDSFNPVVDFLLRGGRAATQIAFGPNIPLATWAVEGTMGAIGGAIRGDNPLKFLLDAIDQNVGSFITNSVGDLVRVRDGKVGLFNVDPPKVRNVAQNCLWLFEEIYSPMLPGKLTADGLSSEMIDRMSSWERFLAWNSRSQSSAMKAIRVATENQANRRIAKDIQNRNLYKLRDSVNKILRNNPNPSNAVLRQVIEDSGVKYNIEVLLAFVRAGLFEETVTKGPAGREIKTGVLETIEYLMSKNKLDRGTVPMMSFFDLEYDLQRTLSDTFGTAVITRSSVQAARTAMMKAMKSYANMAMVLNHPLDGTASATAQHVVLNFYKSYPGLFTAQFLMRRGSVTPGMQFAFELIVYSLADMTYNILLSLASGYYSYEKLKKALEQRDINYREFIRLVMKYPIFSNNLLGLGLQNIVQVLSKNKQDQIISSIAENALGYDIRNIIRALQGFAAYAMGEVPKNSPIMATYNVFGRVIPVLNSTLVKMLLMQAFGDLNYSGRRTGSRSRSSYIIDKIHAVSDDSIRELAIRNMFKQGVYSPADKRNITGEYLSSQSMTPMIQESINEAKKLSKPKEIPNIPQVQPVKTQPRSTASLKELGSTPYAPPEGML